jgi:UrcA family protein
MIPEGVQETFWCLKNRGMIMKESNRVRKLIVAAAVLVLGVPAVASAVPSIGDESRTVVRVSYSDLDLATDSGVLSLYKRIQSAADDVCGEHRSLRKTGSLKLLIVNKQCYDNLVTKLVEKADNAKLDEIHRG